MKILSLFLSLVLFANCKAHQEVGKDTPSDTESLKSDDGSMLIVTFSSESISVYSTKTGKKLDQRYCVIWMPPDRHSDKKPQLLTSLGGLTEKQLKDTLVAAGTGDQIGMLLISPALGLVSPVLGPGIAIAGIAVAGATSYLIAAQILSSKRVRNLIDEDKVVKISNKLMGRSIGRILAAKPHLQGMGTCDHIKKSKIITDHGES